MNEPTPALAAALAKVQADLPKLERDRTVTVETKKGEPYSYSYTTLAHLSEAVLPVLSQHGLSFVAMPGTGSDGKMCLRYHLMHSSGEMLTGEFPLSGEGGIQVLGGRITYARRYCLAAIVGVAAEEDDESRLADSAPATAQRASGRKEPTATAQRTSRAPAPPLPGEAPESVTPAQLTKIQATFNGIGWTDREDKLRAASAIAGRSLASAKDLTKAEASALIDALDKATEAQDPTLALAELITSLSERES